MTRRTTTTLVAPDDLNPYLAVWDDAATAADDPDDLRWGMAVAPDYERPWRSRRNIDFAWRENIDG